MPNAQKWKPSPEITPYIGVASKFHDEMPSRKAVLVVDRDGLIRYANMRAAELLERTPEELQGSCFRVPLSQWKRIELDIIRRDGTLRVVVAKTMPGGNDRHALIELEVRSGSALTIAGAVHLAMADTEQSLAAYRVSLVMGPSAAGTAPLATRPLAARCVRCLLAMMRPLVGELRVSSVRRGEFVTVTLRLRGHSPQDLRQDAFDDALKHVYQMGGFLSLEPETDGFCMRLTLPSAASAA